MSGLPDPAWAQPAIFALECALTALWSGVGVRPGVVAGHGVGELAAAWSAGVLELEDGLRLAASRGIEAGFAEMTVSPPSVRMLSQLTGQLVRPGEALDGAYWLEQARQPESPRRQPRALAELGVDLVLEIGPGTASGPVPLRDWPQASRQGDGPFARAVASAYEAGLPVSFAGLFAGEERRRISLPGYPFQRSRHWFEAGS